MKKFKEVAIEKTLLVSALVTIAVTLGIILVLSLEAFNFFRVVPITDFLTDTHCSQRSISGSYPCFQGPC